MGGGQSLEAKAEVVKSHAVTQQAAVDSGANTATGKSFTSSGRSELAAHMIRERKHANVWDYYQLIRLLGEGSIGSVSLVRRKKGTEGGSAYPKKSAMQKILGCCSSITEAVNDTPNSNAHLYAIKSIQLSLVQQIYLDELKNEIEVLRSLDHPNIVKAYEVYESRRNLFVVMEFCSGGDLYIRAPYTENEAASLMTQLCSAISHMHKHDIVHRDLKFENVMFESKDEFSPIKVLDFGLSKKFLPGMTKLMTEGVGTLYTMAPQVLNGIYSSKADCWSLGVIAFVLLSQRKPFAAETRAKTKELIMRCQYRFDHRDWDGISQDAKDFVSSLIVYDPNKRFSAKKALDHPWLKKNSNEKDIRALVEYKKQTSLMNHVHDNIIGYARMSSLKRIASVVVAHKSSAAEILEIRKAFEAYDTEKDGVISLSEFKAVFSQFNYTDEEMNDMFDNVDINGCNEITFTEFIAATLTLHGRIEEKRLAEAFDLIDEDDTGYISKENLEKLLGKSVDPERVESLIREVDVDGDVRIYFSDFIAMFREDNCQQCIDCLGTSTPRRSTSHSSEA
ncbi:hypothetical protein ACHAWO_001649 [Cyclotella atomus]|uniref:Calmodulin n=1 Tax=Cyclotella atomus TaxID=382360 RepID=A0ABD3PZR8_9STRA